VNPPVTSPGPGASSSTVISDDKIGRRGLLAALMLAPAARRLSGQILQPAPGQEPTYSTQVKLVNLLAGVREKSGKIVKGLTRADFHLEDEGRPQTIKFFEPESGAALALGLLVDTSGSQASLLEKERAAGLKFFDRILRPDQDLAFLVRFDFDVELLQDFTASRQRLESALGLLRVAEPRQQQPQGQQQGRGGRGQQGRGGGRGSGLGGGTSMYDAIMLASEELMSQKDERKALILLSDGVDTGSKVTLRRAIDAAQKADTLVYSVRYADSSAYGGPGFGGPPMGRRGGGMPPPGPQGDPQDLPDGKKVLRQIAQETGGRFYEVGFLHLPIERVFADIEEDLRSRYSLGYTPEPSPEPGVFRGVKLTARTAKKKNLVVTTRTGYYGR
jgi:VWFA-related protein